MKDIDLKEVNDLVEFEAAQTLGKEFPLENTRIFVRYLTKLVNERDLTTVLW